MKIKRFHPIPGENGCQTRISCILGDIHREEDHGIIMQNNTPAPAGRAGFEVKSFESNYGRGTARFYAGNGI